MPLKLETAGRSDVSTLVALRYAAYAENPVWKVVYRAVPRSTMLKSDEAELDVAIISARTRFLKIVNEAEEVISTCRWYLPCNEDKVMHEEKTWETFYEEGTNRKALDEYTRLLERTNAETLRRRCFRLTDLYTRPERRGRGAASMLVEWGISCADADGLPIYLDSEPASYELYKRYGFEDIGEMTMDLKKHGGEGSYKIVSMVKWPQYRGEW